MNIKQYRNVIGFFGWIAVSCIIGLLALPIMVAREEYQYKKYKLPLFEWDDVYRYTIAIVIGSVVNAILIHVLWDIIYI